MVLHEVWACAAEMENDCCHLDPSSPHFAYIAGQQDLNICHIRVSHSH